MSDFKIAPNREFHFILSEGIKDPLELILYSKDKLTDVKVKIGNECFTSEQCIETGNIHRFDLRRYKGERSVIVSAVNPNSYDVQLKATLVGGVDDDGDDDGDYDIPSDAEENFKADMEARRKRIRYELDNDERVELTKKQLEAYNKIAREVGNTWLIISGGEIEFVGPPKVNARVAAISPYTLPSDFPFPTIRRGTPQ